MVGKRERNPISRRLVGGTMWKDSLHRCLRLETERLANIETLITQTNNPDLLREYSRMAIAAAEIVGILTELLRYDTKGKLE